MKTALLLGATGFIGHHMARRLKSEGYWVRVVDIKPYEHGTPDFADEIILADLRDYERVKSVIRLTESKEYSFYPQPFEKDIQFDEVYNFACLMGGAGFVFTGEHDAEIMHDSCLINLNVAEALRKFKGKFFYSSSACMYPQEIQNDYYNSGLKESDAYPANPDSEYGWEKLFAERLYLAYSRNYGLDVRIARFHNIYGPEGTYWGGKEKAPAAMCRKVIELLHATTSENHNQIEVWGTGHQTRSFLYIDDCIDAVRLLMGATRKEFIEPTELDKELGIKGRDVWTKNDSFRGPVNIGSEEMVKINQLAELAIGLSGKEISIKHIDGPIGVMGRNSDNTLIEEKLGWKPKYSLEAGLKITYNWIKAQYDRY